MKIARQGWKFVGVGVTVTCVGVILFLIPGLSPLGRLVAILGLGFALFCVYFFRDPERALPQEAGLLYSPGDGVVLSLGREGPGDITTLRIFLSIFNVHIQRAPCAGVVEKIHYQAGSFAAAMKEDARANERCVMTIKPSGRHDLIVVEQIAGLIARRIECWPKPGDNLKAGERYGIIYFGSQAAVHFPASARCTVKVGDKVAAGITPIGEWIK